MRPFEGENEKQKTILRNRGDFNRRGCLCTLTIDFFSARKRDILEVLWWCRIFFIDFGDPQNLCHFCGLLEVDQFITRSFGWRDLKMIGRFWSKKFELKLRDVNPPEISSFPPWVPRKWRTAMKVMWIFFGFQDPRVSPRETKPTTPRWRQVFSMFTPDFFGEMIQLDECFADGLKPPAGF